MKNDSKIAATKAIPGGAKKGASFTKRSGAPQKNVSVGRKGQAEEYGPASVSNNGASVSDDGAGTRSRAQLPPQTMAMRAPAADLPDAVTELAAATLPVPSADTPLFTVEPWDYARDRKLGRQGS